MSGDMPDFRALIAKVADGQSLSVEDARRAFDIMMSGDATPAQMGGFLLGLRLRGETVEEITGGVMTMREKMTVLDAPANAMDIVGTGGDATGTVNISTATSFVVAACGVPVAKHGNRAASSKTGAADVLTALGVNILGPMSNPAGVKRQLIGVFSGVWQRPMAETLRQLGSEKVWVVHGSDGTDELTTTGPSHVVALQDGEIHEFDVAPEEAGLPRARLEDLKGGAPEENAEALRGVLAGAPGAYRDIVLYNTAAALLIADRTPDLSAGVALAADAIDSGAAREKLERLVEISNRSLPEAS